ISVLVFSFKPSINQSKLSTFSPNPNKSFSSSCSSFDFVIWVRWIMAPLVKFHLLPLFPESPNKDVNRRVAAASVIAALAFDLTKSCVAFVNALAAGKQSIPHARAVGQYSSSEARKVHQVTDPLSHGERERERERDHNHYYHHQASSSCCLELL
ncbi:hypothetical protein HID58_040111, partial [Brassica napus]